MSYDMAGDVDKYVEMTGYWYGDESDIPSVTDMFPTFDWKLEREVMSDNTTHIFGMLETMQQARESPYQMFYRIHDSKPLKIRLVENTS